MEKKRLSVNFYPFVFIKTKYAGMFAVPYGEWGFWNPTWTAVLDWLVTPYIYILPDDVKAADFFSPILSPKDIEGGGWWNGVAHICEDFSVPRTFSKMLSLPMHPLDPWLPYREMFKDRLGEGRDRILVVTYKGYEIWRVRESVNQRYPLLCIPFLLYDFTKSFPITYTSWLFPKGVPLNGDIIAPTWDTTIGEYLLPSDVSSVSEVYSGVYYPYRRLADYVHLLSDIADLEERHVNPQWGEPRFVEGSYPLRSNKSPWGRVSPCLMRNPEVPWWSDCGWWGFYDTPKGEEVRVEIYNPLAKESVTIPPGPVTVVAREGEDIPETWIPVLKKGVLLYDQWTIREGRGFSEGYVLYKVQDSETLVRLWHRVRCEFWHLWLYHALKESRRRSLVTLSVFRTKSRELKDVHYTICQCREGGSSPSKVFLAARSIKFEEPPNLHSILLGGRHISGPLTGVVRKVKWVEVDSWGREVQEEKVELSVLFCGEDSEGPKESAPYATGYFFHRIGLSPAEASYAAQSFGTGYVTERCIAATRPLFLPLQRFPYKWALDVTDSLFMVHPREVMSAYVLPLAKSLLPKKLRLSDKLKGLDITDWLAKKGISVAKKKWWSFMEEPEEIKEEVHLDEKWHEEELQCITVSVGWRYLLTYAVIPNYEGLPPILLLFLSEYDEKGEPVAVALLDATYMKELGT